MDEKYAYFIMFAAWESTHMSNDTLYLFHKSGFVDMQNRWQYNTKIGTNPEESYAVSAHKLSIWRL